MTEPDEFTREHALDMARLLAFIAKKEVFLFSRVHPRKAKWTDVWAEFRQSFISEVPEDRQHRTALVLCWRNRRTKKRRIRTLLVGTGCCPTHTALDLLTQARKEFPEAFVRRKVVREVEPPVQRPERVQTRGLIYPLGLLGPYQTGEA